MPSFRVRLPPLISAPRHVDARDLKFQKPCRRFDFCILPRLDGTKLLVNKKFSNEGLNFYAGYLEMLEYPIKLPFCQWPVKMPKEKRHFFLYSFLKPCLNVSLCQL